MTLKCNEEGRSLSSETFSKISITNLRRQAIPDLSTDMSMNIFKKVCWLANSSTLTHINTLRKQMLKNAFYFTSMLKLLFTFSLRTAGRTERERAPFLSTIQGRRDNGVWGCLSSCTRTTWMCHLHVAPSHLGASLDWVMTDGPWSEVAGPPVSWVTPFVGH